MTTPLYFASDTEGTRFLADHGIGANGSGTVTSETRRAHPERIQRGENHEWVHGGRQARKRGLGIGTLTLDDPRDERGIGGSAQWQDSKACDPVDVSASRDECRRILSAMSKRERMLVLALAQGFSQRESAASLGLTEGRVSQILSALRARVRASL